MVIKGYVYFYFKIAKPQNKCISILTLDYHNCSRLIGIFPPIILYGRNLDVCKTLIALNACNLNSIWSLIKGYGTLDDLCKTLEVFFCTSSLGEPLRTTHICGYRPTVLSYGSKNGKPCFD